MYMAYSKNPHLPRVRMDAVKLVRAGWSYRKVARHTGFTISAIAKWVKKAEPLGHNGLWIPTQSSRPKTHPRALASDMVQAIVAERVHHRRCAEVVHHELTQRGIQVSLSSVKRTLARQHLVKKRSPWKRPHDATARPLPSAPGALIEVDTVHIFAPDDPRQFYVYTLLDVYSRWGFAAISRRATASASVRFVARAQTIAPFSFSLVQSDHGTEFSQWFTLHVGMAHRHIRVRTPNDNAHLERFNRTLQEECLNHVRPSPWHYGRALPEYLQYYNDERPHLSLNFQTPSKRFQGVD